MILFFFWFTLYLLHIDFLVQNIFFDAVGAYFFDYYISYNFNKRVALESLYFVLANGFCFSIFYLINYRKAENAFLHLEKPHSECSGLPICLMNFSAVFIIIYILTLGVKTGFVYSEMAFARADSSFLFELRVIYLLLLSYLLLNINPSSFFFGRRFIFSKLVFICYLVAVFSFQARSVVFELGIIIAFAFVMWSGDKLRLRYIALLLLMVAIPNLIVLGRLGPQDHLSFYQIFLNLFTIEYTVLVNNFLGAVIDSGLNSYLNFSFLNQLWLIVPSFIRVFCGIDSGADPILIDFARIAGSYGGGFSLLGQLYYDFGWFTNLLFGLFGVFVGKLSSGASKVGRVSLFYATTPLMLAMFFLSLRNDFGPLLKYTIQLFIVAEILALLLKIRVLRN